VPLIGPPECPIQSRAFGRGPPTTTGRKCLCLLSRCSPRPVNWCDPMVAGMEQEGHRIAPRAVKCAGCGQVVSLPALDGDVGSPAIGRVQAGSRWGVKKSSPAGAAL